MIIVLLGSSCADSTCKKPPYPPNQDSELTLLMRQMYDHYAAIGDSIGMPDYQGKVRAFSEVHTAKSTEPTKATSPLYQAMATTYLAAVHDLNQAATARDSSYNIVVDQCMNCHRQLCPGPMVKIEKLYLK